MKLDNRNTLYTSEIPELINWFYQFLGENKIKRFIRNYKRSLSFSKYVYREYYLKKQHPWSEALLKISKHRKYDYLNDIDTRSFLTDIKKINILEDQIPNILLRKYKSDLLDPEHAIDYLFEIKTAWQFYKNDFTIEWYTENNKPEFKLNKGGLSFDVECKRINADSHRKIKRIRFYRLMDLFIPLLIKEDLSGRIDITFKKDLPKNDKDLQKLIKKIFNIITTENNREYDNEEYLIINNTYSGSNINIDFKKLAYEFYSQKPPSAHGVLVTADQNGAAIRPLEIIVQSSDSDSYLSGIYETLKNAIKNQLCHKNAGLITCFIPEVYDFSVLTEESSIFKMTKALFLHENFKHLLGVVYVSDEIYNSTPFGIKSNSPILKLFNNNCMHKEIIPLIDAVN